MTRRPRRGMPGAAGVLCATAGVLDIWSAIAPANAGRVRLLTEFVPGAVPQAAAATTVAAGILLVLLGHALRRRKRRAWRAVVVLLAASIVLHLVKGLDVEEATVSAVLLAVLIYGRGEFYAKGDPRTRWRALGAFVGLASASVVVGIALIVIRLPKVVGRHPVTFIARHVVLGLVAVHGPLRFADERTDDLVSDTLFAMGFLTLASTAYLVLRPPDRLALRTPDDEARLRELLDRHGRTDSLGYFALRPDKGVLWSASGTSAITYRVVAGVMLASGNPLGDPGAWREAIDAFLAESTAHAWTPGVIACGEDAAEMWSAAGLDALELGDEAIVEVRDYALTGRAMRNVRQSIAHASRHHRSDVRRVGELPAAERRVVRAAAEQWRDGDTERGFSMALGRVCEDDECVVARAFRDDELVTFLQFVPWGRDGLSLDVMRRSPNANRGVTDYLVDAVLRAAPDLGVARVSLNFAAFRAALERGGRIGAGPVLRLWRSILLVASRWFQIETLYRYNAKFRPAWEPRYICFPSARELPRVALAALRAEAFIVFPGARTRRLRRLAGLAVS
ncbi:MAG: phosphatidylglycerol lysyltransferase domain-containing protein [Mycobacteriales bacterium]|nr:phosphatidylglycerol lysyltransferase domain-containing protein [Frankia sp.]